jgi:hypothetical protein
MALLRTQTLTTSPEEEVVAHRRLEKAAQRNSLAAAVTGKRPAFPALALPTQAAAGAVGMVGLRPPPRWQASAALAAAATAMSGTTTTTRTSLEITALQTLAAAAVAEAAATQTEGLVAPVL